MKVFRNSQVSEAAPRQGNSAQEAPRREMAGLSKEVNRKTVGFRGGAQIGKWSPGGAQAGNDRFE